MLVWSRGLPAPCQRPGLASIAESGPALRRSRLPARFGAAQDRKRHAQREEAPRDRFGRGGGAVVCESKTVESDTPSRFAIARQLIPSARIPATKSLLNTLAGRPRVLPISRARAWP